MRPELPERISGGAIAAARRSWLAGPLLVLLWPAHATAAPFAYIANSGSNDVSIIDTATNTVTATVPGGAGPFGVAVNPAGTVVYVSNDGGNTVSIIDTASHAVTATVSVGNGPLGVAVNPAGTLVYVANEGDDTASVIDAATELVTATVAVGTQPYGVAFHPAGTPVYVANQAGDVSVIDTVSATVIATVPVGGVPSGVAVNPAGTLAYVANAAGNTVAIIDTVSNAVTATVTVGSGSAGVAVTPDGSLVYVANGTDGNVSVIATATNTVIATIPVGSDPTGVAVTPDGTRVYVANFNGGDPTGNSVSVIDTSTNSVVATVPVGSSPGALGQFIGPASTTSTSTTTSTSSTSPSTSSSSSSSTTTSTSSTSSTTTSTSSTSTSSTTSTTLLNPASRFGMVHADLADTNLPHGYVKTRVANASTTTAAWQSQMTAEKNQGQLEVPLCVNSPWDDKRPDLSAIQSTYARLFAADPDITIWEFGLEENLKGKCCSSSQLATLASKLGAVQQAKIQAGTPGVQATYQIAQINHNADIDAFLGSAAAAQTDVLALHPYDWPNFDTPETWHDAWIDSVAALQAAHGTHLPIYYTEVGAPQQDFNPPITMVSGSTPIAGLSWQTAAEFLVKLHVLAFNKGVQKIFWYHYQDRCATTTDAECHFGLKEADGTPRLAYNAYLTLTACMAGTALAPSFSEPASGLRVYRFAGPQDCLVAWNYPAATTTVMLSMLKPGLTAAGVTSAQNTTGTPIPTTDDQVQVTTAPIFIRTSTGEETTSSTTSTLPTGATTTSTIGTTTTVASMPPSTTSTTLPAGTCASPIELPAAGGTVTGRTAGTSALSASCAASATAGAPETVFRWTPATSGTATIATCNAGTTFDTVVSVRSGACGSGTTIACNDDSTGCTTSDGCSNGASNGSRVTATVTAGQTYFIIVDGYSGRSCVGPSGTFVLTVTAPSSPTTTTTITSTTSTTSSTRTTTTTSSTSTTSSTRTTTTTPSTSTTSSTRTTTTTSTTISTTTVTTLPPSTTSTTLPAGTCASPIVLPAAGGTFTRRTAGTSALSASCAASATAGAPETVFRWIPTTSGTATIATCNAGTTFDTVVSVRSGTCSSGTTIACNDDTTGCTTSDGCSNAGSNGSRVTATVTAGQTYFIIVDGYSGRSCVGPSGTFVLTVTPP